MLIYTIVGNIVEPLSLCRQYKDVYKDKAFLLLHAAMGNVLESMDT